MMTDNTTYMETLAIAFLTGQATADEAAEYQRLFEANEYFRTLVGEIGVWLAPLNKEAEDIQVPAGLLGSIMAEIETVPNIPASVPSSAPAPLSAPTPLPLPANDRSSRKWKAAAMAASLVAALAIGSHFVGTNAPIVETGNQQLMALLSDSSQPQLMAIVYDPSSGHVVARLSNITIPEDGDLQLWLIREGEGGPVSLGVLDRAKTSNQIEFNIPKSLQQGTDVLAVSLEGLGGSKSAGPEGPVLFTGSVSQLTGAL